MGITAWTSINISICFFAIFVFWFHVYFRSVLYHRHSFRKSTIQNGKTFLHVIQLAKLINKKICICFVYKLSKCIPNSTRRTATLLSAFDFWLMMDELFLRIEYTYTSLLVSEKSEQQQIYNESSFLNFLYGTKFNWLNLSVAIFFRIGWFLLLSFLKSLSST